MRRVAFCDPFAPGRFPGVSLFILLLKSLYESFVYAALTVYNKL